MPKSKTTETMITISRSYARKIQCENFGGNKYETADFWAMREQQFPTDTPKDELEIASGSLYNQCKQEVENAIRAFTADLKADIDYKKASDELDAEFAKVAQQQQPVVRTPRKF